MTCWEPLLETDWGEPLGREFDKRYWIRLHERLEDEWRRQAAYPPREDVFAALILTSLTETRVVILGQDPYYGPRQAHGLAFSVRCGVDKPPTLANILEELRTDLGKQGLHIAIPNHGNLEQWARHGVLLLNTALTVGAGAAGSHRGRGWWRFTNEVIRIVDRKTDPVVFILWGADARRKKKLIQSPRHTVIESSHPSPISAHRPPAPFIGSRPFSRANSALSESGREPIVWTLPDCPESEP